MPEKTIIPFGPQHPVLPEPLHLDLVLENEKVVEAIPSIGFIHRGLEKLVEKKDFFDFVFVAERICGVCSFIHGLTYCLALEKILGANVPERASYLRVFWSELSRIHSHLLWLGLLADSFGFESLFMHVWRIRDKVLDIIEETTGGRVIFGSAKIGGTKKDVKKENLAAIIKKLQEYAKDIKEVSRVVIRDASVMHRLRGVGILKNEDAHLLGAVGPVARASGIETDIRKTGYAAYNNIEFKPVIEKEGDCYARCLVRIQEIFVSIDMIRQLTDKIPEGPVETKINGFPNGEFFARTEQPRGEVVYYAKADGSAFLKRLRIRTPTFANIPSLLKLLKGVQLADVQVLVLSIDPCISCAER